MSTAQGNIFLTTENLAFSLPLLLVCGSYAYFKYVPLHIGLPILGGIFVLYLIRNQLQAQRAKKIENMDDKAISDLALELEGEKGASGDDSDAKAKKLQKKKAAIEHRLAAERKKEAKKQPKSNSSKKKAASTADDDDDDDDVALDTFAKGSRSKKKN